MTIFCRNLVTCRMVLWVACTTEWLTPGLQCIMQERLAEESKLLTARNKKGWFYLIPN